MSHIDSFKHELVGYLGYIPVYHPLEIIDGDFFCNTNQLLIGGGSGEHPALVIESPLTAVAYFLDREIGYNKKLEHWKEIIEPYLNKSIDETLTFYEWEEERVEFFHEMLQSNIMLSPCYSEDQDLNEWFLLGIGEFVFYSMPHLANEIMNKLSNPYSYFQHISYNNILVVPPNFPVYAHGGNMFFNKK